MRISILALALSAALASPGRAESCRAVHAVLVGAESSLADWYRPGRAAEVRSALDLVAGWTRRMGAEQGSVALVARCGLDPLARLRTTMMGMYPDTGPLSDPAVRRSHALALVNAQNLLLKAQNHELKEIADAMKEGSAALAEQIVVAAAAFASCDGDAYLAAIAGGPDYLVRVERVAELSRLGGRELAERASAACKRKAAGERPADMRP